MTNAKRIDERHAFNIHIAAQVGIEKAILLGEIYGWCLDNYRSGRNMRGGLPWTWNSARAYSEKFIYMTSRSINRWLDELEKAHWIASCDKFNKEPRDRTKWYTCNFQKYDLAILWQVQTIENQEDWLRMVANATIGQNGECNCQNGECNCQNGEALPSLTTSLYPTLHKENVGKADAASPKPEKPKKEDLHQDFISQVVEYLNKVAGTNYKPASKHVQKFIRARIVANATIEDFRAVVDFKAREWGGTEMAQYLRPETLFGNKFDGYLEASKMLVTRKIETTKAPITKVYKYATPDEGF